MRGTGTQGKKEEKEGENGICETVAKTQSEENHQGRGERLA